MALSRRAFLVTAGATCVAGATGRFIATGDAKPAYVWRGKAMGRDVRVALYGTDGQAAGAALTQVAAEIERLETLFSLHRETSELSRLNRDGRLMSPSPEMVSLLRAAMHWRTATAGAFDPTVEPLVQAAAAAVVVTPQLLARTGSAVDVSDERIAIGAGSALTLNGIARGRIADRVTEILLAHGYDDVVIDAGELRIPGRHRRAVGIPAAKVAVSVAEVAIATSEPKAKVFQAEGFRHHLIDPHTGASPRHWQSVSVFAPTAEAADALSTAFAVLPQETVADIVAHLGDVAVIGADWKGRIRRFGDASMTETGTPSL